MIPGKRPYRVKLPPLFHCICRCFFFVELHLFSFLFAASVYFFTESRGKVILHNFWPHEHNHNVLAVTYVVNTSIIFISPTIEKAYEYLKKADNFISFKWSFVLRWNHIWHITATESKWQQILTSVSLQRLKKNERKKRQMMWMWVKICLKMNLPAKPSNIDYDFLPTFPS